MGAFELTICPYIFERFFRARIPQKYPAPPQSCLYLGVCSHNFFHSGREYPEIPCPASLTPTILGPIRAFAYYVAQQQKQSGKNYCFPSLNFKLHLNKTNHWAWDLGVIHFICRQDFGHGNVPLNSNTLFSISCELIVQPNYCYIDSKLHMLEGSNMNKDVLNYF